MRQLPEIKCLLSRHKRRRAICIISICVPGQLRFTLAVGAAGSCL